MHLIKKIKTVLNHRRMFSKLFSPLFIIKNAILLNYHFYLKKDSAPDVLNIDLKVTKRCNANCYFCYTDISHKKTQELSTKKIIKFINSFGNKKKAFFINGGEPFLRKDIFEIIKAVKKQGSYCGIVTNGTLLDKKKIKKLLDTDIDNIVFSLHAGNDKIMKIKDSYKKIVKALNLITEKRKQKKPYIMVNSVINPKTYEEFEKIINDCENADTIRFSHPSFLLKNEKKAHELISYEQFGKEIKTSQFILDNIYDNEKVKHLKKDIKKIKTNTRIIFYPDLDNDEIDTWYSKRFSTKKRCMYLYTSCFVDEKGNVNPCQFYQENLGNITKKPFTHIWNSKKYKKFRKNIRDGILPGCSRCCKLF